MLRWQEKHWVVLTASAALAWTSPPTPIPRERVEPFASEAQQAIRILQEKLLNRLTEAMRQGGVSGAIDVCSTEASRLTSDVVAARGVEVGRTSFRLRNPRNTPRAWAAAAVNASAGKKAFEVGPMVFDLGDRVGLLQPIPMGAVCLACHGGRASLSPGVTAALSARYPDDRAVDFVEGDLRGFFWAEVKKR